jgi:heme/copper-type cytochrome/quinol oxidase subunit 2
VAVIFNGRGNRYAHIKSICFYMMSYQFHHNYIIFVIFIFILIFIIAVSFIGGEKRTTRRKPPTCHNATRLRYIHTINLPINLNTDLLLFGSTDLTNTLNTDIFLI